MNNLKEILEDRCMTQRKLSDKTGISEITISRYVNGKRTPNVREAMLIARALNVSVDTIWPAE